MDEDGLFVLPKQEFYHTHNGAKLMVTLLISVLYSCW